jgi:CBS domain-containing protein
MTDAAQEFLSLVGARPPFQQLPPQELEALAHDARRLALNDGDMAVTAGAPIEAMFVIAAGSMALKAPEASQPSILGPGDFFGARSCLREGVGTYDTSARGEAVLYAVPRAVLRDLTDRYPEIAIFFDRARRSATETPADPLLAERISALMTANPITVAPDQTVGEAARVIRDRDISCLPVVTEGRLVGILTTGDLADRVLAEERDAATPVAQAMTPDPLTIQAGALAFDALLTMTERRISHLPVLDGDRLAGVLTSTNLVRRQASSAVFLVGDIATRSEFADFADVTARIPCVLAQMVGAGASAYDVGRILTTVSDALTRRLIALAESRFGPPPVPYVWGACGSQGRREQTGVSDQDNCLILHDDYNPAEHGTYFKVLAEYVSDGLDAAGYVYCPGDMMATADRWRRPHAQWRRYFQGWIAKPDEEAQMLASVMFDLRAIAGDAALLDTLRQETLHAASRNSIFRAHMVRNSVKHQPPLGLFRGLSMIRSGQHKDAIDMKHAGVVPIVDLGRLYALAAGLSPVNTRDRLTAALEGKVISASGARDLLDAYDLIADMRLAHQARLIREGGKPDNFMRPAYLSELERNHLKDAFQVVKTMQGAASNALSVG